MMFNANYKSGAEKANWGCSLIVSVHCCSQEKRPARKDSLSGFTLIEVLIVVVIIAIAAMMAVPMMSSADGMQLRSAVNMVSADIEYAKSMAISRGQNFSVVFDATQESYRIKDESGNVISHPVKKGFDYIVDFQSDGRLNKVGIEAVDFNSGSTVEFDCLGSPVNGGTITLQAGGENMTVSVEPVTGFISITN